MATCLTCGRQFMSALQLGAHARTATCEVVDEGDAVDGNNADVITAAEPAALHELARRKCGEWGRIRNVDILAREIVGTPRDYVQVSLSFFVNLLQNIVDFICLLYDSCRGFGGSTRMRHTKVVIQNFGKFSNLCKTRRVLLKTRS